MKKIRYVYYNKFTGQILEILSKRKQGSASYIECDIENVLPILAGKVGINDVIVAYNKDVKKDLLIEKNNVIKLRNIEGDKLYKIPYKKDGPYDLRLIAYPASNIIEVTIDLTNLTHLYATNLRDQVKFEKGSEIRIFIKDKKTDELLKTIVIDAQNLLDSVQILLDTDDINLNNVSFYTNRVFQKYLWNKAKIRFFSPASERIQFDIHKADTKKRSKDFSYHLEIKRTPSGLKIKNNIENFKVVKIYDPVQFFIVDKLDPNILYDKFALNVEDLERPLIPLVLKNKVKDKAIYYNHKYISVLFEEQDND